MPAPDMPATDTASPAVPAPGIFWLTRDFRFDDNPALLAALAEGPLAVHFFLDRLTLAQGAASRWRLERALRAFDAELRRRTGGTGITLWQGEPEAVFPALLQSAGARSIHQSDWPAPEMRALQTRVRNAVQRVGGELVLHAGHLLVHPRLLRTQQGAGFKVYTPFARALRRIGPDRPAPDAPQRITAQACAFAPAPAAGIPAPLPAIPDLAPDLHRGRAALETFALPAGEAAAHARFGAFLDQAAGYGDLRDRPDLEATSGLSEHLALGEISPRRIWARARLAAEADPARAAGIGSFLSEVIWREFAWHLLIESPDLATRCWRPEWEAFPWRETPRDLADWRQARTGVALVDAGLREMWLSGRMHNRVRMVVASWLTKHLLIDWRAGLAHFADCLTDWDPAANAMNWQWVAGCGPDASPFFRIFNPEKQARQFDPEGRYRARWLEGYGWPAPDGPEARAYREAIPRAWLERDPRDPATAAVAGWQGQETGQGAAALAGHLAQGRARALAAYDAFRERPSQAQDRP